MPCIYTSIHFSKEYMYVSFAYFYVSFVWTQVRVMRNAEYMQCKHINTWQNGYLHVFPAYLRVSLCVGAHYARRAVNAQERGAHDDQTARRVPLRHRNAGFCPYRYIGLFSVHTEISLLTRGGGLGSRPIFKKFHETYAPS